MFRRGLPGFLQHRQRVGHLQPPSASYSVEPRDGGGYSVCLMVHRFGRGTDFYRASFNETVPDPETDMHFWGLIHALRKVSEAGRMGDLSNGYFLMTERQMTFMEFNQEGQVVSNGWLPSNRLSQFLNVMLMQLINKFRIMIRLDPLAEYEPRRYIEHGDLEMRFSTQEQHRDLFIFNRDEEPISHATYLSALQMGGKAEYAYLRPSRAVYVYAAFSEVDEEGTQACGVTVLWNEHEYFTLFKEDPDTLMWAPFLAVYMLWREQPEFDWDTLYVNREIPLENEEFPLLHFLTRWLLNLFDVRYFDRATHLGMEYHHLENFLESHIIVNRWFG